MITIYGIASCDSCRSARRWFEQADRAAEFHDLRVDGCDRALLQRWVGAVGWEALLNRRSITWRKIPEVDRMGLTEAKAIRLMLDYPTLIRRPVIEQPGRVVVGVDEDAWREFKAAS